MEPGGEENRVIQELFNKTTPNIGRMEEDFIKMEPVDLLLLLMVDILLLLEVILLLLVVFHLNPWSLTMPQPPMIHDPKMPSLTKQLFL